nr:MAG TPA: hypothetical protein [Caudoviricetes sp.]
MSYLCIVFAKDIDILQSDRWAFIVLIGNINNRY